MNRCGFNRELKEVDHFRYIGSMFSIGETKMRIVMVKEAFNKKYHC